MLAAAEVSESKCFETTDSRLFRKSATFLIKGGRPRDIQSQAARLGQQFIRQNRWIFNQFDVEADLEFDGANVDIVLRTKSKIGAFPMFSPTTGKPDYGLIIKPRFEWEGLGVMLGEMGWKIIPEPVSLPILPRSDRKIPPWVLSTVVLFRLKNLLEMMDRRFEFREEDLRAPRGNVNWNLYANVRIPSMKHLNVPCRFPDLEDDRDLLGAIHFTLKLQRASLESQRHGGVVVVRLLDLCESLLSRVRGVVPKEPAPRVINLWMRQRPILGDRYQRGIQAIEWTVEERGLAGLSDLSGLPWQMSMSEFYEAWVETVTVGLTKHLGGVIKIGRQNETVAPISWDRPYRGSQKYLKPDIVIERMDEVIIIDAKFKEHWQEMSEVRWGDIDADIRERHREDILQILAYSTLFSRQRVVACLAYPCHRRTWERMRRRGQLHRHATVYSGMRRVDLVLTAVPMVAGVDEIVGELVGILGGG